MRKFIVTVDTEGDNLWDWKLGNTISTENADYMGSFQELCEKYSFKPVYLVNYEMAQSDVLVDVLRPKAEKGLCEIGMHLHAWNSPPKYELPVIYSGCPYITEYPQEVIYEKHKFLQDYIEDRFGQKPVTYRAGRWATDDRVFSVLETLGFKVDCSVAPGISLKNGVGMTVKHGNSYVGFSKTPYRIKGELIEVPMTTRCVRSMRGATVRNRAKHFIKGEELWLRPVIHTYEDLLRLRGIVENEGCDYLEFMIHSSELMPGGSPYGKTEVAVRDIYSRMERFFEAVSGDYEGIMLKDYHGILKESV